MLLKFTGLTCRGLQTSTFTSVLSSLGMVVCAGSRPLTSDLYRNSATRALRLSVFKRLNSKTILSGVGEEQECAP